MGGYVGGNAPMANRALESDTADALSQSVKINGIDFDGTKDIELPNTILTFDSEIKSLLTLGAT